MSLDSLATVKPEKAKGGLSGLLGGGKTYFLAAGLASVVAMGGVFAILGEATQRVTYYVLTQDVAARTPISVEMLAPMETGEKSAPPNALDLATIRDNQFVSLTPLRAGDVLSRSTVGPLTRINNALPADFVVGSFQVTPENAVAGKVRKGDYVDIIASDEEAGIAKIVLRHVLILDVAVNPSSIAQAANNGQEGADINPGPESNAIRSGIPSLYTVALSPKDATKLALIKGQSLTVVLSANQTASSVDVQSSFGEVFTGPVGDSGAGTEKAAANAKAENGEAPTAPAEQPAEAPAEQPAGEPAAEAPAEQPSN